MPFPPIAAEESHELEDGTSHAVVVKMEILKVRRPNDDTAMTSYRTQTKCPYDNCRVLTNCNMPILDFMYGYQGRIGGRVSVPLYKL